MNFSEALVSRHKKIVNANVLCDSAVLIIGVGTVGSLVSMYFTRIGVSRFILVDCDTVEASNLSRTVYVFEDVGKPKVEALANRLRSVNPGVNIITIDRDVRNIADSTWLKLASKTRIALIAIDNIMQQVRLSNLISPVIPVVVVSIEDIGNNGEIIVVTSQTRKLCCLINLSERLREAPEGVSGAQGLITDVSIVVAEAVNLMVHLLQPSACKRFPHPFRADNNVFLVGRGDGGNTLQANLKRAGVLSSLTVNTRGRLTPCNYCKNIGG